jgi:hypothetical protein
VKQFNLIHQTSLAIASSEPCASRSWAVDNVTRISGASAANFDYEHTVSMSVVLCEEQKDVG